MSWLPIAEALPMVRPLWARGVEFRTADGREHRGQYHRNGWFYARPDVMASTPDSDRENYSYDPAAPAATHWRYPP